MRRLSYRHNVSLLTQGGGEFIDTSLAERLRQRPDPAIQARQEGNSEQQIQPEQIDVQGRSKLMMAQLQQKAEKGTITAEEHNLLNHLINTTQRLETL